MQAAQEMFERQGVGVSKEGQQLFDCFYKTMPCKWQGKTILVLGEVLASLCLCPGRFVNSQHSCYMPQAERSAGAHTASLLCR